MGFDITNDLAGVVCQPGRMASRSIRLSPNGVYTSPCRINKLASEQVAGYVEPHSENTGETLSREKEKLALAWLEETLPTLKGALTSDEEGDD